MTPAGDSGKGAVNPRPSTAEAAVGNPGKQVSVAHKAEVVVGDGEVGGERHGESAK